MTVKEVEGLVLNLPDKAAQFDPLGNHLFHFPGCGNDLFRIRYEIKGERGTELIE